MSGHCMSMEVKSSVSGALSSGLLAGIATTIEPGLGIVAFSGATLRPLVRQFFPHTLTSRFPDDPFGQDLQSYGTTYTRRPNYQYNMHLMAHKEASMCRDSNSTFATFDKDSRAASLNRFKSGTYDSVRSLVTPMGSLRGLLREVGDMV